MSSDLRRRELAAIHLRARDRGLDDDAYRAVLREVAGVSSARDLDAAGRRRVLDRLGPRPKSTARRQWGSTSADPLVRKVYALLGAAEPPRTSAYAVAMLRHMFGAAAPEAIEWCNTPQLRKLVQALEIDRRRRRKRA